MVVAQDAVGGVGDSGGVLPGIEDVRDRRGLVRMHATTVGSLRGCGKVFACGVAVVARARAAEPQIDTAPHPWGAVW
ncbi:hypothetical protein GCM10010276_41920 [Streptomyces longisporus]|uniref:Uncharacterized protein n=1 Tax=Streptomyces longisporus TaxID=1948 RepID=A0ABN3M8T3_STRLO